LARAYRPGMDGAVAARQALDALASGDATRAGALFGEASRDLDRAARVLDGRLTSLGLLLPGLRANVATARALVEAGQQVVVQASSLSAVVEASALPLGQGAVPASEARRLAPELAYSASVLERAAGLLAGYDRPYLWPSLGATVRDVRTTLLAAASDTGTAAEVARLVPPITGQDGARRYFLVIQDNAELRGAGGVPRLWGELVADEGRLRLDHLGPIEELNRLGGPRSLEIPDGFLHRYRDFGVAHTWQNVTVSPDFSVTGEVISSLYPQSGGRPVDGVVAVDLPGLAALVDLAGPVTIEGRPEPLTAADVLSALGNVQPPFFSPEERHAFFTRVAAATVQAFTSADVGTPARLAAALGPAVRGGHLLLYASRAEEERLFERLGVAGRVPGVGGDSLLVVNQNLTAAPLDAHLRRRIRYDVLLDPDVDPAAVRGRVEVTLSNQAPRENRTELSIYTPLGLRRPAPDVTSSFELGRRAYSSTVPIPPAESRTVAIDVQGGVRLAAGGWYHLDLPRQSALLPDDAEISVSVPPGWRIADARGGVKTFDGRHAQATLRLDADHRISLRLERSAWSRLWARIRS
ncbi:MAG: DUF4012 domain-containing protein, partial [Actinomycetota bacterium]|nr:DUF4012 domain-containing protein [Actinomycetota bacterium]